MGHVANNPDLLARFKSSHKKHPASPNKKSPGSSSGTIDRRSEKDDDGHIQRTGQGETSGITAGSRVNQASFVACADFASPGD